MQRGVATFTLDTGRCPRWLFERMVKLGREMTEILIEEYGPDEFVRRIADPVWFQSLGTVLAFDWNASGLTTILTAALKEGIRGKEREFGIAICGGKGKTSRRTPEEIVIFGERLALAPGAADALGYNSRMAAKVDSALVQDGFQIYHHAFFFSKNGAWAVVQQGMNTEAGTARRYHWFDDTAAIDFVSEPHRGIVSQSLHENVLNLAAAGSARTRSLSTEFVRSPFPSLMKDIELVRKYATPVSRMASFRRGAEQLTLLDLAPVEFSYHPVIREDFSKSKYLEKILARLTAEKPESYERLIATEGVGPKTVRALSLVGEVIYGAKPSYEDPARYSFAHGGKDATPFPVDRKTYDETIAILKKAVERTGLDVREKRRAVARLEGRAAS